MAQPTLPPQDVSELRRLLEAATPGPWELWTGSSWRRFGSRSTGVTVCEPIAYSDQDDHPDLHFNNGGEEGPDAKLICALRNHAEARIAAAENIARIRKMLTNDKLL